MHVKSIEGTMSFKFPFKLYLSVYQRREPSPPWRIKIKVACLWTILRDECQTIRHSPLRYSSLTLNPTYVTPLTLYFNGILVESSSEQEHVTHVVFERFQSYGASLNPLKCIFGHKISTDYVGPLPKRVATVRNMLE